MPTGPFHYAEAERLMNPPGTTPTPHTVAQAQVHATLALAAATALGHWNDPGMPPPDRLAWEQAASERPAAQQRSREAAERELEEFRAGYRGVTRDKRTTSTAEWFHAAVAAGCTGTSYDPDTDTIIHDGAPSCPVHEPGDVVPVEDRQQPLTQAWWGKFSQPRGKGPR